MPKIELKFEVFSNDGSFCKNYRNESIIGNIAENKFTKRDLISIINFIKKCMIGFNKGDRGIRYGRRRTRNETSQTKK